MCGIFGFALRQETPFDAGRARELLQRLYLLSESRGKESAGLHLFLPRAGRSWTLKVAERASRFVRSQQYRAAVDEALGLAFDDDGETIRQPIVALAHSRLVTNGAAELDANNQPVRWGDVTMVHNGIIVNVEAVWRRNPSLQRAAEVDTEVMAALLSSAMKRVEDSAAATQELFDQIEGSASIAWAHPRVEGVTLATNTGDLFYACMPDGVGTVFASERYILAGALQAGSGSAKRAGLDRLLGPVQWLSPRTGLAIDLSERRTKRFEWAPRTPTALAPGAEGAAHRAPWIYVSQADESLLRYNESRLRGLRRCRRCVLPETFPFIGFDSNGVCQYCRSYQPRYAGMEGEKTKRQFIESLHKYRRPGNQPDVLVPFSGGRDSSYGLHLIHHEFGLKPVTFTYDWGMVTDLARRNIARMCGRLGVQNILVSADIKQKRDNIRKNVAAWLKRPDLGMVPLFMAGDKHFFSVVNDLKRQTGIQLNLWCANPLENTDFKSGLCGVPPNFAKERLDYLSLAHKAQLALYYASRFATNPSYLNSSLLDTFGAFVAYYFAPRTDFYFMFHHFVWEENEVERVLLSEYDWERSPDSSSTWRIGDGTAPFYNYIYVTAKGFSEFDTFRSNQIREGAIDREQALDSVLRENRPRAASLRWYLETIGLDFDSVIRRINELDVLALHR